MADKKRTIFVSGLDPSSTTKQIVYNAFVPFGEIIDVQLPADPKNKKLRGYALVEYELDDDATEAIDNMNFSQLSGNIIRVSISKKDKNAAFDITHSKVAVWEQEGWIQEHQVDEADRQAVLPTTTPAVDARQPDAMQGLEAGPQA
ncbi:RNA-binding domain-containing protein-containing protein [Lipomyces japonicus]|uniref:RNA-binding domain-containing protein-containing protein n=1 Tax=Lipomyces japonicus TaxID=56871 RepID=UPI0034CE9698